MFALVDCNSFYASCETLFRPDLRGKPVIVLSNNDGCVVARSNEAKRLGIKMGVPVFQIKAAIKRHQIRVFSSNYALYADISARVMQTLEQLAPQVEVYSIDEAFLQLPFNLSAQSLLEFGQQTKHHINHDIGVPVCIGIAPTKTLAKLANHAAKKYPATQGVVDLSASTRQRKLMALVAVSDVWGVGRRLTPRLNRLGIHTALDLADYSPKRIRQHFSIVLERTLRELNNEPCIELEQIPSTKQQIVCSRSFGRRVTDYTVLREALASFTARATEKLRTEKQLATSLTVFVATSSFTAGQSHYRNSATGYLAYPSDDTRLFLALVERLLTSLWRDHQHYAKAGVRLSGFENKTGQQIDLFVNPHDSAKREKLMAAVDQVNQQQRGQLFFAAQGTGQQWSMTQARLSPAYTTRWCDLPTAT